MKRIAFMITSLFCLASPFAFAQQGAVADHWRGDAIAVRTQDAGSKERVATLGQLRPNTVYELVFVNNSVSAKTTKLCVEEAVGFTVVGATIGQNACVEVKIGAVIRIKTHSSLPPRGAVIGLRQETSGARALDITYLPLVANPSANK
jgi:hypothetical protein